MPSTIQEIAMCALRDLQVACIQARALAGFSARYYACTCM